MRGLCWAIALLILFPTAHCAPSSSPCPPDVASQEVSGISASATVDAVPTFLISAVMPAFAFEYVEITNTAESTRNLRGWAVDDLEGSVSFAKDLMVPSGSAVTLVSDDKMAQRFLPDVVKVPLSSDLVSKKGRFLLADEGDEVLLRDPSGNCQDVIAFGKSTYSGPGWVGKPFAKVAEGEQLSRNMDPLQDSDSSVDWHLEVPGRSSFASVSMSARVEPFLAPEQMRGRVVRELRYAQSSVSAAVYELTDDSVVAGLRQCAERGVRVRVLLEGEPVGGMPERETVAARLLVESGCEVLVQKTYHGYKRYDYLHAKYMVIDGRRILLTSENWATTSFDGNRGWGLVIDSYDVARYYGEIFESDFDPDRLDLSPPPSATIRNASLESLEMPQEGMILGCSAVVTPVVSPDTSFLTVHRLLDEAQGRILLELFYWDDASDALGLRKALVGAASRGVTVRVLLDGTWYNQEGGGGNQAVVAQLNALASERGLNLEARLCSAYHRFTTVHNKGAVVDDRSLVSSINWGLTAFRENREAAALVCSTEVADFFAKAFYEDWTNDSSPPIIRLAAENISCLEGERVVIDASNSSDDAGIASFAWDVGDDGQVDWLGPVLVCSLPAGEHRIRLTLTDASNNSATRLMTVHVAPREVAGASVPWQLALSAIPIAIIWKGLKRVKRRKRD